MLKVALNPRQIRAQHAIARVCASGLSSLELFRQIAPHVRAAVPYACSGWLGTDPATLLCTTCYVENIRHEDCVRLKDNELFCRDFAKFEHLARSGRNAASLLGETDGQLEQSARYRHVYDRLGVQDELRMVFRGADVILGIGCFVRIEDAPPFTRQDLAFVDAIATLVGEGLRRSLLLDRLGPHAIVDHDGEGAHVPGLIVLRADNSIESMTAEARALLDEMTIDVGVHHELPTVIYHVAHAVRRAAGDPARGLPASGPSARSLEASGLAASGPPTNGLPARGLPASGLSTPACLPPPARIRLPSGRWLFVHASPLASVGGANGPPVTAAADALAAPLDRIAVVLQPARRAQLAPLFVELYGLTEREREVTALLVRGLAIKEIARTLSISLHTVRDHVKVVFAKLSVTSRPELTANSFTNTPRRRCSPSAAADRRRARRAGVQ